MKKLSTKQYQMIEDSVLFQGNKISAFADERTIKALVAHGFIVYEKGTQGFDYSVKAEAITAAIEYIIHDTIGAKLAPIKRIMDAYTKNGGALY